MEKLAEEILNLIDNLKDKGVIVEGKKDKAALEKLDVENIIMIDRRPLFMVVEEVSSKFKSVALLVDLDKEGKLLYSKLNHDLSQKGVHIDNELRNYLFRKTKLREIEGLDSFLGRLER